MPTAPSPAPEDPIVEAYPMMMDAAENLCCGRHAPGGGCYPYHRGWPFKRMIGHHGSVWRHGAAYLASFRALARAGNIRRILVSGSADYSLLAHVCHAYRHEGVEPEITVLDYCPAPLAINRWYAERIGIRIDTVACDILKYEPAQSFDLISTDNFLSQFTPADRHQIVRRWWKLLRPGGVTVGAQGVRNSADVSRRSYTPEQAVARREKILHQVQGRDPTGYLAPEAIGPIIEAYYLNRSTYPFRDADDVNQLLTANGFHLERGEMLSAEERARLHSSHLDSRQRDRVHYVARRLDELPPAAPSA